MNIKTNLEIKHSMYVADDHNKHQQNHPNNINM
jgi:hypothetical protein